MREAAAIELRSRAGLLDIPASWSETAERPAWMPPPGLETSDYKRFTGPFGTAYPAAVKYVAGFAYNVQEYVREWQQMDPVSKVWFADLVDRIGDRIICGLPRDQGYVQAEIVIWEACQGRRIQAEKAAREASRDREGTNWPLVVGGGVAIAALAFLLLKA